MPQNQLPLQIGQLPGYPNIDLLNRRQLQQLAAELPDSPQVIRSFLQKAEFRIDTLAADGNLAAVVVFHKQQTNNMNETRKRKSHGLEEVRSDVAYPLRKFVDVVGRGESVLHEQRTAGQLPMAKVGNHWWVLGEDWLAYLRSQRGTD